MNNNRLWCWGYVLKKVPDTLNFVPGGNWCSLETGARYIGADNVVFMDSTTDAARLDDEYFQYVAGFKQVVCGLQHGKYAETAKRVSEFSLTHPNITGAIIDDFFDYSGDYYKGPSAWMKPKDLKEVRDALRSVNPALKLYIVRYTRQPAEEMIPYLPYFDALNLWVWKGTVDFWETQYADVLARYRLLYQGKEILQGLFCHDYGLEEDWGENLPVPPERMEVQCRRVSRELRAGHLDGWCFLQNGWFGRETHRKTILAAKNYIDWFYGTTTLRDW